MEQQSSKPHFCDRCKRIMIPANIGDELYYVCRNLQCGYKEQVSDEKEFHVYSKNYTVIQTTSQQVEVKHDPTYPRINKKCEHCGCEREFVYYYASNWSFNCSLQIFYICSHCGFLHSEGGQSIDGV